MFTVFALSLQVVLRAGVFAFASAGFWGVGAFTVGKMELTTGVPFPVSMLLGLAIAGLGGLVLSLALCRLSGLYLAMATFAFNLVLAIAWEQSSTTWSGGPDGLSPIQPRMTVWGLAVILVGTCWLLSRLEAGRVGRAQKVMREDVELAISLGVRAPQWRHTLFVFSALLGALSGELYALSFWAVAPSQFGFEMVVIGLATVVIGGVASWRGALVGASLVLAFPGFVASIFEWREIIFGALLVIIAIYAPEGLLGLAGDAHRRVRRRLRGQGAIGSEAATAGAPYEADREPS